MILHRHKAIIHYNFHKALELAWISQDAHWPKKIDDTEHIDSKREVTKKLLTISLNTIRSLFLEKSLSITDLENIVQE